MKRSPLVGLVGVTRLFFFFCDRSGLKLLVIDQTYWLQVRVSLRGHFASNAMSCCKITEAESTPGVNEKYSGTFTDKIPFVLFPESCNTTKSKNDFVLNIHKLGTKRKVKSESSRHFCTCHGVKKVNCFSVSVVLRDHVNTLAAGPRWAARDCVTLSMRTSGPWNAKNATCMTLTCYRWPVLSSDFRRPVLSSGVCLDQIPIFIPPAWGFLLSDSRSYRSYPFHLESRSLLPIHLKVCVVCKRVLASKWSVTNSWKNISRVREWTWSHDISLLHGRRTSWCPILVTRSFKKETL